MSGITILGQRNLIATQGSSVDVCDVHFTNGLVSVRTDVLFDCVIGGEASAYIRTNRDGTISVDLPIEGNLSLTVGDTSLKDFLDHFENEINEADVPPDEIAD